MQACVMSPSLYKDKNEGQTTLYIILTHILQQPPNHIRRQQGRAKQCSARLHKLNQYHHTKLEKPSGGTQRCNPMATVSCIL